jgi:hypothetical protein
MSQRIVNQSAPNTKGTVLAAEALSKFAQCANISCARIEFVEDGKTKSVELTPSKPETL